MSLIRSESVSYLILIIEFENQEKNDMMNFKDDEGNGDVEKSVDSSKSNVFS